MLPSYRLILRQLLQIGGSIIPFFTVTQKYELANCWLTKDFRCFFVMKCKKTHYVIYYAKLLRKWKQWEKTKGRVFEKFNVVSTQNKTLIKIIQLHLMTTDDCNNFFLKKAAVGVSSLKSQKLKWPIIYSW